MRPALFYLAFLAVLCGAFFTLRYAVRMDVLDAPMRLWGQPTGKLVLYWTVLQSLMHFYFDGFLWKMRQPSVVANV